MTTVKSNRIATPNTLISRGGEIEMTEESRQVTRFGSCSSRRYAAMAEDQMVNEDSSRFYSKQKPYQR